MTIHQYTVEMFELDDMLAECFNLNLTRDQLNELLEGGITANNVEDAFFGMYDSIQHFAEELVCEINGVDIPDFVLNHIDWQSMWDCELRHDFDAYDIDDQVMIINRHF